MRSHRDLSFAVHQAWARLRGWVSDLEDEEYFWEPAPGAFAIRRRDDGLWKYDYAIPDPQPAPPRTIGWLVVHLASCKEMYWEYAYGPAQRTWDQVFAPPQAASALTWLEHAQELVESALRNETNLERPVLTNWGDTWPAWKVFWTLAEHDLMHGAEISALRDLRRAQVPQTTA